MQDVLSRLAALNRPRLMVRTARIGAGSYVRDKALHRILGYGSLPNSTAAILKLLDMEQDVNQKRLEGDADYTMARHIDILIALMGEANLLRLSKSAQPL